MPHWPDNTEKPLPHADTLQFSDMRRGSKQSFPKVRDIRSDGAVHPINIVRLLQ